MILRPWANRSQLVAPEWNGAMHGAHVLRANHYKIHNEKGHPRDAVPLGTSGSRSEGWPMAVFPKRHASLLIRSEGLSATLLYRIPSMSYRSTTIDQAVFDLLPLFGRVWTMNVEFI